MNTYIGKDRIEWWGTPGQRDIPIFTDGSKLSGGTGAGVLCRGLGLELHFRLKDACSVFQEEAIQAIVAA